MIKIFWSSLPICVGVNDKDSLNPPSPLPLPSPSGGPAAKVVLRNPNTLAVKLRETWNKKVMKRREKAFHDAD